MLFVCGKVNILVELCEYMVYDCGVMSRLFFCLEDKGLVVKK